MTSSGHLLSLLEKRYETQQGWLLFQEVRNTTGYARKEGYCDAMALSVWPSRGVSLHGFELKASRSDLISELRQPKKADEFTPFCDHWWLVVADKKLVEGVEVPASWGILAPRNHVLYAVRDAPKRDREEWKPTFVASLLRRFHQQHTAVTAQAIKDAAHEMAKKMTKDKEADNVKHLESEVKRLGENVHDLNKLIREFENATGLNVRHPWNLPKIGEAVRALMHGVSDEEHNARTVLQALQHAAGKAEQMAARTREAIQAIELFRVVKADEEQEVK